MARTPRWVVLGGAAMLAAVLLEGAMLARSGQPVTGATDAAVRDYYGQHWVAVVVGNLLWLPGAVLLTVVALAAVQAIARDTPRILRRTAVSVSAVAGVFMILSSVFALVTVITAQLASAQTTGAVWSAEVGSFTVAMLCWMVAAMLFVATSAHGHRITAVAAAVVAVALLVGGDVAWWALLAGVVAAGVTAPAAPSPVRMTVWTSGSQIASTSLLVGPRG